jgi:hypothetical protein
MDHQLTPEDILKNEQQASSEGYLHRVLVAFDIFCNVAIWLGLPDETISSHTRRINDDPSKHSPLSGLIAKFLNLFLDDVQSNHGARAEAGDLERALTIVATERQALGLPPVNLLK